MLALTVLFCASLLMILGSFQPVPITNQQWSSWEKRTQGGAIERLFYQAHVEHIKSDLFRLWFRSPLMYVLLTWIGVVVLIALLFAVFLFWSGALKWVGILFLFIFSLIVLGPTLELIRSSSSRKKAIQSQLPDYVESVIHLLDVGLTVDQSFRDASRLDQNEMSELMQMVFRDAQYASGDLLRVMQRSAAMMDVSAYSDLVSNVTIALEKGTSLSSILKEFTRQQRNQRQAMFEQRKAKATFQMMIIATLFMIVPMLFVIMLLFLSSFQFT